MKQGVLPFQYEELGKLCNLTNLWLNSNQLSGTVPSELGGLSSLQRVETAGQRIDRVRAGGAGVRGRQRP